MNISLWFSFTREIVSQRDELRLRVSQLEEDKRLLTDALARASNKQPVYHRPEVQPTSSVPELAFGPTATRARREIQEQESAQEIFARAEAARNGNPKTVELPSE